MMNSKIEWCDHTFNAWVGCEAVSAGCEHCYAERYNRFFTGGRHFGPGKPRRRTSEDYWRQPMRWQQDGYMQGKRPLVFCGSQMDWLDPAVDPQWLNDLFRLIGETPGLFWLMLTKRPELFQARMDAACIDTNMPPNVAVGVTVENQEMLAPRVQALSAFDAGMSFMSCEPLLGPIDFGLVVPVDWVIAGGENGPHARPCNRSWISEMRSRCYADVVPFFFKGYGDNSVDDFEACDRENVERYLESSREWPEVFGKRS